MQNKPNCQKPELTVIAVPQKGYEEKHGPCLCENKANFRGLGRTPSPLQRPAGAVTTERSWLQPAAVLYRPEECGRIGRKQVLECC